MRFIRSASTLIPGAALILLLVTPAWAATPAFEFGIDVNGSSIEVIVDFEPVPPGFAWGSFEASGVPEELVGIFPATDVDDRGRPLPGAEPFLLSLERVEWGIYQDSVDVQNGQWAVVGWPFSARSYPGAARTEVVTIGDAHVNPGPAQTEGETAGGLPVWMGIGLGAITVSAVTLTAVRLSAHRERVESDSV